MGPARNVALAAALSLLGGCGLVYSYGDYERGGSGSGGGSATATSGGGASATTAGVGGAGGAATGASTGAMTTSGSMTTGASMTTATGTQSSSTGGPDCDPAGADCADCMACAIAQNSGPCAEAWSACGASQECVALRNCTADCGGPGAQLPCTNGCVLDHPGGAQLFFAASACLCGACSNGCAGGSCDDLHCFNGQQDMEEQAVDCSFGTSPDGCLICDGFTCTQEAAEACKSGNCVFDMDTMTNTCG